AARRNACPKTKPHHLQRQTGYAHTGIRNPQKLKTTASNKTVAIAASLCDAFSRTAHRAVATDAGNPSATSVMRKLVKLSQWFFVLTLSALEFGPLTLRL